MKPPSNSDSGEESPGRPWRNVHTNTERDVARLSTDFKEKFRGVVLRVLPDREGSLDGGGDFLEAMRVFTRRWLLVRVGSPYSIEFWVHRGRITPHVWCPLELESHLRRCLTAAYPQCAVERSGLLFHAVRPGERAAGMIFHSIRGHPYPIRTEFKVDPLNFLLAALVPSGNISHAVLQVHVTPLARRCGEYSRRVADRIRGRGEGPRPPSREALAARVEGKIGHHLNRVTLRAAAFGPSERVHQPLDRLEAASGLLYDPETGNGLRAKKVPRRKVPRFLAATATRDGAHFRSRGLLLTSRELAPFAHLPCGEGNPVPIEWALDRATAEGP